MSDLPFGLQKPKTVKPDEIKRGPIQNPATPATVTGALKTALRAARDCKAPDVLVAGIEVVTIQAEYWAATPPEGQEGDRG